MRKFCALAIAGLSACVAGTPALASHVGCTTTDLGGGQFRYDLFIDNSRGIDAVSGLSVVEAGSVLGLDAGSSIGSPSGWDYFPPDSSIGVDSLDYFSLDPSADVAVGASLGGFSFDSATDPGSIGGGPIVEAINDIGETVFFGYACYPIGSLGVAVLSTDLGGGLYQYEFSISNLSGVLPIEGFSLLAAASVLGLDSAGVVAMPTGWDFLAPDPSLGVDSLDFFAFDSSASVAVGGVLGGFVVQSMTAPGLIGSRGLAVELLGSGSQVVYRGVATAVPEPSSMVLTAIAAGLLAVVVPRRRRRVADATPLRA